MLNFVEKFSENYDSNPFDLNKLTCTQLMKMDMPDLMISELKNFIHLHQAVESLILLYFMSLLEQSGLISSEILANQLIELSSRNQLSERVKRLTEVLLDEIKEKF